MHVNAELSRREGKKKISNAKECLTITVKIISAFLPRQQQKQQKDLNQWSHFLNLGVFL